MLLRCLAPMTLALGPEDVVAILGAVIPDDVVEPICLTGDLLGDLLGD